MISIWEYDRIGFTGTHFGMTDQQKEAVRSLLEQLPTEPTELHHGDCVGADAEAHAIARQIGLTIIGHPPTNPKSRAFCDFDEKREKADYLIRNRYIVDETEVLIACPSTRSNMLRSGTWSTVRYAFYLRKPVIFVYPDGEIVLEIA